MAKAPTKKPAHRTVVIDPVASIDAKIRENVRRIAELRGIVERDQVRVGDLGFRPGVEGEQAEALIAELENLNSDLKRQRVRAIAGVPDASPPAAGSRPVAARQQLRMPSHPRSVREAADFDPADEAARLYAEAQDWITARLREFDEPELQKEFRVPRAYTQGLHYGLVKVLITIQAARKIQDNKLAARLDRLEELIEETPWAGTYQRALGYRQGKFVGHDGSMWVALRDVDPGEIPGKAREAWQLAVKAGRDGKDALR